MVTTTEHGPVETKVRADVGALVTAHPMGEALAETAFRLARLLDGEDDGAKAAALSQRLMAALTELAREGVDDDDLSARLSSPDLPATVRDTPKPGKADSRRRGR